MTDSGQEKLLLRHWLVLGQATRDARLSRSDLAVLHCIAEHINKVTKEAFPGVKRIASITGADRRTVTRSVARLCDTNYIIRNSGNRFTSNTYLLGTGEAAPTDEAAPTGEAAQGYGRVRPKGRGEPAPLTSSFNQLNEPALEAKLPAAPCAVAPSDPVSDPIWGSGLQWLMGKGIAEKPTRSLLGKLRKACGDIGTAALLDEAQAQDITDPAPWLLTAAAKRGHRNAIPVGAVARDDRDQVEIDADNERQLRHFGLEATA
ncbi:MAG: helix-turn-helix domain-containing protein [Pseudoxanthomonas sp.]